MEYEQKLKSVAAAYALFTGAMNKSLDTIGAAGLSIRRGYAILSKLETLADCPSTDASEPGEERVSVSNIEETVNPEKYRELSFKLGLDSFNRKTQKYEPGDRIYLIALKLGFESLLSDSNRLEVRVSPTPPKVKPPISSGANGKMPFHFM